MSNFLLISIHRVEKSTRSAVVAAAPHPFGICQLTESDREISDLHATLR